jgi:uncharacterized SAM-binding protein YcdF (DUF218 family)
VATAPDAAPRPRADAGRRRARALAWIAAAVALLALVAAARAPLLRAVAGALVVEDPLEPAAAIVALGGQVPFRPMEAAELYRGGWAPRVVLVPGARLEEHLALRELGIALPESWEVARDVLHRLGVPAAAIVVADGRAEGTLEELALAARAVGPAERPVILVTSRIHTRRVRLTWDHVTGGRPRGLVRVARGDPFEPERWWQDRQSALAVVREYLGLLNYGAGFPVAARPSPKGAPR